MKLIKALKQFPQIGADLSADFRRYYLLTTSHLPLPTFYSLLSTPYLPLSRKSPFLPGQILMEFLFFSLGNRVACGTSLHHDVRFDL
jgi:hypothetical protein